jgi:hypothetical protein
LYLKSPITDRGRDVAVGTTDLDTV